MEHLTIHFEGSGETCPCGSLGGSIRMVISSGGDELVIGPRCTNCLYNHQHFGHLDVPKIAKVRAPTSRMKRTSRRQEERVGSGVGARSTFASGAMSSDKSDSRLAGVLRIENKFTYSQQFPLVRHDLNKIRSECQGREVPALQIDFKDRATNRTQDAWICVPHIVWEKMFNAATDH